MGTQTREEGMTLPATPERSKHHGARGVVVSSAAIRPWGQQCGHAYAHQLRRRRPCPGDPWHVEESLLPLSKGCPDLWRAVDQNSNVLDMLGQSCRNTQAAKQDFRKSRKGYQYVPGVISTENRPSVPVYLVTLSTSRR